MNPNSKAILKGELDRICRIIDNAEIGRAPESYIDARLAVQALRSIVDDLVVTPTAEEIVRPSISIKYPGIGPAPELLRIPKSA